MKFELTNSQRFYVGLDPIPPTWDEASLRDDTYRPDIAIYFERDTIRRHTVSTDDDYKETKYNEPTRGRKVLFANDR